MYYDNLYKALYKQASSEALPEIQFQFVNSVQANKSWKDVAAYAQVEMYKKKKKHLKVTLKC